jgi:EAL domain-containing protein (putative c-di-GMP-specific phosphodiesterase class I)
VEITEQDMATATEEFHEQLRALRNMGYKLWLDDFGSGYSSLNVFSRFDVDLIKFDMALIQHLDDRNGINREIIKAMISIARAMGIETLAEGIETEDQQSFLKSAGCDLAQGFLLRRPVPMETILYIVRGESYTGRWETEAERKNFRNQYLPPEAD